MARKDTPKDIRESGVRITKTIEPDRGNRRFGWLIATGLLFVTAVLAIVAAKLIRHHESREERPTFESGESGSKPQLTPSPEKPVAASNNVQPSLPLKPKPSTASPKPPGNPTLNQNESPRWEYHVKMKPSWPHLLGSRDMNYDDLVVPGLRIGPVVLGGNVSDAVRHLGNPDSVNTRTQGGRSDLVQYVYKDECVLFDWWDEGPNPKVSMEVDTTCAKWHTSSGIRVGSLPIDAVSILTDYCNRNTSGDSEWWIETKEGLWFWARNRDSPIFQIRVSDRKANWDSCN